MWRFAARPDAALARLGGRDTKKVTHGSQTTLILHMSCSPKGALARHRLGGAGCGTRGRQACRARATRGSTWGTLRSPRQELADGGATSAPQKAWPGNRKDAASGAPRGALPRSQEEAARRKRARAASPAAQGALAKPLRFPALRSPSGERGGQRITRARTRRETLSLVPAKAGTQRNKILDSRFRGNERSWGRRHLLFPPQCLDAPNPPHCSSARPLCKVAPFSAGIPNGS